MTDAHEPADQAATGAGADDTVAPSVRVVIVNYNGGELITQSLDHVLATDWPADRLEVVVVDNGSTDGSADVIATRAPTARVIRSERNLGFTGGCNLGMHDLAGVDYVAIVNNDAFVSPGWLRPLVAAMEEDASIGAVNPKILFDQRYVRVELETDGFPAPPPDPRELGVRVSGIRVEGADALPGSVFVEGFYGEERSVRASEPRFCWSGATGALWVRVDRDRALPCRAELRLASDHAMDVRMRSGEFSTTAAITTEPDWYPLELRPPALDVINNVGSVLVDDAYGADRGFLEHDAGQYENPDEVFSWCGAVVLLRREYIEEMHGFDDRLFIYYEDVDLSWRGRLRGWRYLYVPNAVVRHRHAATTVEGSPFFEHYMERNRLVTLVKNAPAGLAWREVLGYARHLVPLALRGDRETARRRLRSFRSFLGLLPHALRTRWRIGRHRTVRRRALMRWSVPRSSGHWALHRGRN